MRLFNPPSTPRPTELLESSKPYAIKAINELLQRWDKEEWVDEGAAEHIYNNYFNYHNGYEIAKAIENDWGIQPDADLCEILDGVHWVKRECIDEQIKQWAKLEQIDPQYKVGDKVTVNIEFPNKDKGIHEGTIISVDSEKAQYTINFPSLGHVLSGNGTRGRVLNYEEVEPNE